MSLNTYIYEASSFLRAVDSPDESNQQKLEWLGEEFELLKHAVESSDMPKMQHQLYDMMYLLFELAAANNLDLDSEWALGAKRKAEKYLS